MPWKKYEKKLNEIVTGYSFILPYLIIAAVFTAWPLFYSFYLSFHSYDIFTPPKFVGIKNYIYLFHQGDFLKSLYNTTYYTIGVVAVQTCLALALALILDQKLKFKPFFRVVFFLPSVTSSVAISLIFIFIFYKSGILNHLLHVMHLDLIAGLCMGVHPPVDWLGNPKTALKAIMIQNIWTTSGFFMLIFLAALQDIPENLYEAARVDGASTGKIIFKITVPLLKSAIFYVITVGAIGCFQVFDQIYIMTGGGPLKSTLTTAYLIYSEAFNSFNLGYACTIAFTLATVIYMFTMIEKKAMGE